MADGVTIKKVEFNSLEIVHNMDDVNPFLDMCLKGKINEIKDFLLYKKEEEEELPVDKNGGNGLMYAIKGFNKTKKIEAIQLLIEMVPGIQTKCTNAGLSPFQIAIVNREMEIIKSLFHIPDRIDHAKKVSILKDIIMLWNFSGFPIVPPPREMITLWKANNPEMEQEISNLEIFIKQIIIKINGTTSIHLNAFEMAQKTISRITEHRFYGYCYNGNFDSFIEYLSNQENNPYICDSTGKTGLVYAILGGQLEIVKCLLRKGVGIQIMGMKCGVSPFQIALGNPKNAEIIKQLIDIPSVFLDLPINGHGLFLKIKNLWEESSNESFLSPKMIMENLDNPLRNDLIQIINSNEEKLMLDRNSSTHVIISEAAKDVYNNNSIDDK